MFNFSIPNSNSFDPWYQGNCQLLRNAQHMCLYFVGGKLYWEYAIRIETTFDTNTIIVQISLCCNAQQVKPVVVHSRKSKLEIPMSGIDLMSTKKSSSGNSSVIKVRFTISYYYTSTWLLRFQYPLHQELLTTWRLVKLNLHYFEQRVKKCQSGVLRLEVSCALSKNVVQHYSIMR